VKNRTWAGGPVCVLTVLLCMLASKPHAEIGMNDDWSYIFSAKRLAETGHILYNGWATAILGAQLYFGALFIHIFGFSFTTVRSSTMCLALLSAYLCHALMTRCGIRSWIAIFGTLTLMLSPLYLGLSTTFMSDSSAMFFVLLFFHACVRCDHAESRQAALIWLVVAVAAGLAGGSIRQIVFLCNLVALPGLLWHLRKRHRLVFPGIILWGISIAAIFAMIHWFNRQPYVSVETLYHLPKHRDEIQGLLLLITKSCGTVLLFMSPVLFLVALQFPRRGRRGWIAIPLLIAIVVGVDAVSKLHGGEWWSQWLLGNYVTVYGRIPQWFMLGPESPLMGWGGAMTAVAMFVVTSTVFAVAAMGCTYRQTPGVSFSVLDDALCWTGVPFVAGYLLLVFTRSTVYDRYFLPILFLAILFALRWLERHVGSGAFMHRYSWLGAVPLALVALYGVANTHDMFAAARARLAAIEEVRAAGVPRIQIRDGFEFDGWTQAEISGYVNEPRIRPASAYIPLQEPKALQELRPPAGGTKPCHSFFFTYAPEIHARYVLQNVRDYCFTTTNFAPVSYKNWLPPYDNTIYIGEVPEQYR
jgi:hypothetical protein